MTWPQPIQRNHSPLDCGVITSNLLTSAQYRHRVASDIWGEGQRDPHSVFPKRESELSRIDRINKFPRGTQKPLDPRVPTRISLSLYRCRPLTLPCPHRWRRARLRPCIRPKNPRHCWMRLAIHQPRCLRRFARPARHAHSSPGKRHRGSGSRAGRARSREPKPRGANPGRSSDPATALAEVSSALLVLVLAAPPSTTTQTANSRSAYRIANCYGYSKRWALARLALSVPKTSPSGLP